MREEALKQHDETVKSANEALYDVGFADGKGSVEIPADQAEFAQKLAELQAKLSEAQEVIAKVTSDDESDKAAIKEGHAKLDAIKAILVPAPIELPVVDNGSKGTDAQP